MISDAQSSESFRTIDPRWDSGAFTRTSVLVAGTASGVRGGGESGRSTRPHPLLEGRLIGAVSTVPVRVCVGSGGNGGIGSNEVDEAEATDAALRDTLAIGDLDVRFRGTILLFLVSESKSERVSLRDTITGSDGDSDEIDDCEPLLEFWDRVART